MYGYPSTGGVLVKDVDLLDMLFLSLSRSHESQRSPSVDEEDRLCDLMRRTGAKWWSSREDRLEVRLRVREMTEEEETVLGSVGRRIEWVCGKVCLLRSFMGRHYSCMILACTRGY
jgi:hypothetical protein